MTNRIVVDVKPDPVPFLGGKLVPRLVVELADGEVLKLAFPEVSQYGRVGLNMFLEVLQEDARSDIESYLLKKGFIGLREDQP